jgi:hypothetical protein
MHSGTHTWRHRPSFWLMVAGATVLLTIEPAFSLVLLALGLSALTVFWVLLLVGFLLLDAFGLPLDDVGCPALKRDASAPR